MAPEQALGDRGAMTTTADVYALGAILYEGRELWLTAQGRKTVWWFELPQACLNAPEANGFPRVAAPRLTFLKRA